MEKIYDGLQDQKSQACLNLKNKNKIMGTKRSQALKIRSFSEYIDKLIEQDLKSNSKTIGDD